MTSRTSKFSKYGEMYENSSKYMKNKTFKRQLFNEKFNGKFHEKKSDEKLDKKFNENSSRSIFFEKSNLCYNHPRPTDNRVRIGDFADLSKK